jgi:hypothetical protein
MKYNQQLDYRKRKRFIRRVWLGVFLVMGLFCVGLAFLYYENFRASNYNAPEQTTTTETSAYFAPSFKVLRSQFFQFQANNNWVEVPSESTANKFVYRYNRSNLVEHELVVYVNEVPANVKANRVLPVEINMGNQLQRSSVSDHCNSLLKSNTSTDPVITFQRVTFACNADSTNYSVIVGQQDGRTSLTMIRPDSTSAQYTILYNNLKATPDAGELYQIVDSFQTR